MKKEMVGTNIPGTLRLERTLKGFIVVLPLLVLLYGTLVALGYTERPTGYSELAFVTVTASLVLLTVTQLLFKHPPKSVRALYLVAYHIVLVVALLFVFGVFSVLLISWLLMIIASLVLFGKKVALLSYLGLVSLIIYYVTENELMSLVTFVTYALGLAYVAAIVLVFTSLRSYELSQHQKLATAEARQDEQREALLTIINGTPQAIFTISSGGIIRIYNAALMNLVDTNQSLSGKKIDEVLSLRDLSGESISLLSLIRGSTRIDRDDLVLGFADGDEIRLHVNVNKIQSAFSSRQRGDGEGYVCIARDITKEKSLDEERDEFISVVSHELRTPVAITEGTLSNVQFLVEQGASTKKLTPALKDAHEQVVLLANMINDLGTLSRAERGVGDSAESIDVRDLVEGLYHKYAQAAEKKSLVLNIDVVGRIGSITTSRLYLEEMLQNLITNSIKYTVEGSVTIKVRRDKQGIEFSVKDTGIGISKADLKHIFDKFYRSEDYRTRETSGTGLGLYVAQKLMYKLGTKVEVLSRLNHGSTFSFVIHSTTPKPSA